MIRKLLLKNLLYGFYVWLIPCLFAFLFYNSKGELNTDYDLFKSIMIVVACAVACYFLTRYFKLLPGNYLRQGLGVGLTWMLLSLGLDSLILLPIMKTGFLKYYSSIGLRYWVIPLISSCLGYNLEQVAAKSNPGT